MKDYNGVISDICIFCAREDSAGRVGWGEMRLHSASAVTINDVESLLAGLLPVAQQSSKP